MIGTLAFFATLTAPTAVFTCKTVAPATAFVLSYAQDGRRIGSVNVVVVGTPRPAPDRATRWKGRAAGDTANFTYAFDSRGAGVRGSMELKPAAGNPGEYRLSWTEVAGLNSHVPLETRGEAICQRVAR